MWRYAADLRLPDIFIDRLSHYVKRLASLAERGGFEPSVPRKIDDAFEIAFFASAALPVSPQRPTPLREGRRVRIPLPPTASLSHQWIPRQCRVPSTRRGRL